MIDTLALSEVEENIDVAEILQNKLYYEGETLDMVLRIVMGYSRQSLTYVPPFSIGQGLTRQTGISTR